MNVIRPRSDEPYAAEETAHILMGGMVGGKEHPWEWSSRDAADMIHELDAILAKKRPVGFAPWPEDLP